MSATPTAFRLRVFAEPPPLFLGLRGTPISISWRVPAGRAGNLCPVISQKTMTGAPLDRRLYRRKQPLSQGARRPPGDRGGPGPRAGLGRPGGREACGRCRISPGLSAGHSREATTSSRRETCLGPGTRASFPRRRRAQLPPPGPALTFSLRKMGVAVVKGIVMDTLESGQMLPVLLPSWKVGAEGGPRLPRPRARVSSAAEAPFRSRGP